MGKDITSRLAEFINEESGYQAFFKGMLKKFGVNGPDELEGDKKKKFFDAIDKGWKGKNEKD